MIEAKGLTVRFAKKTVFENLSFTLPDAGVFTVRGDSGRGKTTLLRVLAGLLTPNAGIVTGLSHRRIGFVFQEDRLLPWATAMQNVSEVSNERAAKHFLSLLGLSGALHLYPRELSGGMARRAAIARALAYSDDVLLLDEPFTGLDATAKKAAAACIRERGKLILIISHDADDAALLSAETLVTL